MAEDLVAARQEEREARLSARDHQGHRSSDHEDPTIGWTVQEGLPLVEPDPAPKYAPEQLPDPQIAIEAGFPPQFISENLIGDENTPRNEGTHAGAIPAAERAPVGQLRHPEGSEVAGIETPSNDNGQVAGRQHSVFPKGWVPLGDNLTHGEPPAEVTAASEEAGA